MTMTFTRRHFLMTAATAAVAPRLTAATSPNDRITVALMGAGTRGNYLSKTLAAQPNVTVAYICDPDSGRAGKLAATAGKAAKGKPPEVLADFRKALDDKSVDVLVCAAPNHWHGPATILACAADKHVYVEKPCSHNPREGELMVEATRKHNRVVQMGSQRRSSPGLIETMARLKDGEIGRVHLARAWYTNNRVPTGRGTVGEPPAGLDYDLWQGPAPRKPFRSNYLHYTWHWFWHWGNGELGNNGVHTLDVCRWGMGLAGAPERVTSAGGRYRYDDDQETPDTHTVSFEYPATRQMVVWEGLSCDQYPASAKPGDVVFFGEKGSLSVKDGGCTVFDVKGKEVRTLPGPSGDAGPHMANFLATIRGTAKLNAEIAEGATSTLLCHLGNISHRTGKSLKCDPKTGKPTGDPAALALWTRDYEKGWEPRV